MKGQIYENSIVTNGSMLGWEKIAACPSLAQYLGWVADADEKQEWRYMDVKGEYHQLCSRSDLKDAWMKGHINENSIVKNESMKGWEKISECTALRQFLGSSPWNKQHPRTSSTPASASSSSSLSSASSASSSNAPLSVRRTVVLSAPRGGTSVRVWDIHRKKMIAELEGHEAPICDLQVAAGDLLVVTGKSWFKVWDLKTKEATYKGFNFGNAYTTAVSHEPFQVRLMASAGDGDKDRIRLWNLIAHKDQMMTGVLEGHKEEIRGLHFNADNDLLASGGMDTSVRIWDIRTQQLKHSFTGLLYGKVNCVHFINDHLLCSGSYNGHTVRFFDTRSHKHVMTLEQKKEKHERYWAEEQKRPKHDWITRLTHDPLSETMLAAAAGDHVVIWDTRAKKVEEGIAQSVVHHDWVSSIWFESYVLYALYTNGDMHSWNRDSDIHDSVHLNHWWNEYDHDTQSAVGMARYPY